QHLLFTGMSLRTRERVAAVGAEFRRGQAIEIIEQDVVSVVVLVLGITIDDLTRAKTRPCVVRLSVMPVENPAIVIRHHALVRLTDKGLRTLGGKKGARLRGL